MCGIFGAFSLSGRPLPPVDVRAALEAIRHRGPDDDGIWTSSHALLGSRRLSIIDPSGGHQPMTNERGNLRIVMNGEIFDYEHLLAELEEEGHRFHSRCDTEVALHLFEGRRDAAIDRIDGQYAIALHDERKNELLLLRDRTGICPLFYTVTDHLLAFASEMKALFASGLVTAQIDVRSLDAVTCFGCIPPPRTLFRGIRALPAGHYLVAQRNRTADSAVPVHIAKYWDIPYPLSGDYEQRSEQKWAAELNETLAAAVSRRLRSDVPVGLYLSGGIDSASVGALLQDNDGVKGRVFSIGFPERAFDESMRTRRLAKALALKEQYLRYTQPDLARDFPRLLFHAESPLISTESVPLFALSALAGRNVKVVLTGEGSDEALGGYDYFLRDALLPRFEHGPLGALLRIAIRNRLGRVLRRGNPILPGPQELAWADEVFGFYPAGAIQMFFWRLIRSMTYSTSMQDRIAKHSDAELLDLPLSEIKRWDQLNRSLYVSSRTFLQSHLLAAHGDRALMAHSVEGRYPFLDRAVQEYLARVPPDLKIQVKGVRAREKHLLREAMRRSLPREVIDRRKKPFLAPFGTPFVGACRPEYVDRLLSVEKIAEFGYFDPGKVKAVVDRLAIRARAKDAHRLAVPGLSRSAIQQTVDGMAVALVLSVQLLEHLVRSTGFRYLPQELEKATICVSHAEQ